MSKPPTKTGSKASGAAKTSGPKAAGVAKTSGPITSAAPKKAGLKAAETSGSKKPSGVALWSGTMTCNVQNRTGGRISVVVKHYQNKTVDTLPFTIMENNESRNLTINVESPYTDEWSVFFMITSGLYLYRVQKVCNVTESDLKSGKPVNVVLRPQVQGFSISLPVSSSCNDNSYNNCY